MTAPGSTHARLTPLLDSAMPLSDAVSRQAPPLLAECERLAVEWESAAVAFAVTCTASLIAAFTWAADWPFAPLWFALAVYCSGQTVRAVRTASRWQAGAYILRAAERGDGAGDVAALARRFLDEYP
jgi:hypothetical protein